MQHFERDILLTEFYLKKIYGNRRQDVVIVDEVDCLLLDKGDQILYLTHDIEDMILITDLFTALWKIVLENELD